MEYVDQLLNDKQDLILQIDENIKIQAYPMNYEQLQDNLYKVEYIRIYHDDQYQKKKQD